MIGSHKALTSLTNFALKAKNNPDFAAAVFIGYGLLSLQVIVQIFLLPLYLQALGVYRFGALMILIGCTSFAFVLVGSLYSVLLRLFGGAQRDQNRSLVSALYVAARIISVGMALLCGIIIIGAELIHPFLFEDAPPELHHEIFGALLLSILHLMFLCEVSVNQALLAAGGRQAAANLVTLVGLAVFAVTIVPALLMGTNLLGVMICFLIGDVASRFFVHYLLRKTVSIRPLQPIGRYRAAMKKVLSGETRPYFAFTVVSVGQQADVLIIGIIGGPLAAAHFVLVWKIAEMLILILSRVTQHLQAEFVRMDLRGERSRLRRIYREVYIGVFVAALFLGLLYSLFGAWIVELWVGQEAVPTETWSYIWAGLAILWLSMARLSVVLALSLEQINPLIRLAGLELAAKVVLIFLLFPHWGYLAPIIAISVTHLCGIAYGYYALGRSTLSRLEKITS